MYKKHKITQNSNNCNVSITSSKKSSIKLNNRPSILNKKSFISKLKKKSFGRTSIDSKKDPSNQKKNASQQNYNSELSNQKLSHSLSIVSIIKYSKSPYKITSVISLVQPWEKSLMPPKCNGMTSTLVQAIFFWLLTYSPLNMIMLM